MKTVVLALDPRTLTPELEAGKPSGPSSTFSLGGAKGSWQTTEEIPWVFTGLIHKHCSEQEARIQPS